MSALDILEGLALYAQRAVAPPSDVNPVPDLQQYDHIIVAISGKDSLACLLHLLELGVPKSKMELMHHDVDGGINADGTRQSTLMDWPCTHGYIKALGKAFDIPVYFSYREMGLEGEMLRVNSGSHPIVYQRTDGRFVSLPSDRSKPNTRLKFPQVSASLASRWCSWIGKISVCDRLLIDDNRFQGRKTLLVTGERAEESANRARYAPFEPHRADNRGGRKGRHIDSWRAVHHWSEREVWDIIGRNAVLAHPCYFLGWNRGSCFGCVFQSKHAWATMRHIAPERFNRIADYETQFGYTIHRTLSVVEQADRGTPFVYDKKWVDIALSYDFNEPIFMSPWLLPPGAYGGDVCGPP